MPTEIHKHNGQDFVAITEIAYQDGGTLRDITEVHYNDAGTFRQVFGASVTPQVPAWAPATPNLIYKSSGTEGISSFVTFSADVVGNFVFAFDEIEQPGSTGTPTSGTYKPIIEVDADNYEIAISFTGASPIAIGSGTLLNGTFQNLDIIRGVKILQTGTGTKTTNISVEIRAIAIPANTTGVATFSMTALVTP